MKVTVDANVMFSCLIREGATRSIWFNPAVTLHAPRYLLTEFMKHRQYLLRKYDGSEEEFNTLTANLASNVNWVADEDLAPYLPAAESLIEDPKDWLYIACALREDTIVWSNDKGFRKQNRIKTKTTEELMKDCGHL